MHRRTSPPSWNDTRASILERRRAFFLEILTGALEKSEEYLAVYAL
jgi:hypothetical protein